MLFDEEWKGAEETANVLFSNTGKEKRKASEANRAQKAFFLFLAFTWSEENLKYALKCYNLDLSIGAGECELACCVVVAGSLFPANILAFRW